MRSIRRAARGPGPPSLQGRDGRGLIFRKRGSGLHLPVRYDGALHAPPAVTPETAAALVRLGAIAYVDGCRGGQWLYLPVHDTQAVKAVGTGAAT